MVWGLVVRIGSHSGLVLGNVLFWYILGGLTPRTPDQLEHLRCKVYNSLERHRLPTPSRASEKATGLGSWA